MIHHPLHPGTRVKEICVDASGLSVTEAAKRLGVDRTTFSRLINGRSGISAEMAIRLSKALKTSAEMWINMQTHYDLYKVEKLRNKFKVKPIKKNKAA